MAATENQMQDEIIGKTHFTTPEDRKGSFHYLKKSELLKIKEELQANEIGYANFLEFCAKYQAYFKNNGPEEPISFESFQADLWGIVNRNIEYGNSMFLLVLDELLKTEGVIVNWRHY